MKKLVGIGNNKKKSAIEREEEVILRHPEERRWCLWTESRYGWNGDCERGGGKFTQSGKGYRSVLGVLKQILVHLLAGCCAAREGSKLHLAKSLHREMLQDAAIEQKLCVHVYGRQLQIYSPR